MRTWLKNLREQRGMSQRELAEAVGVSRTIIQCWEAGQKPTDENKVALARTLGSEVLAGFHAELQAEAIATPSGDAA